MTYELRPDPVLLTAIVMALILLPELIIHLARQSCSLSSIRVDDSSLASIWVTIVTAIVIAVPFGYYLIPESLFFQLNRTGVIVLLSIWLFGLLLRIWSIYTLGSFFTVNVAIHKGHQLIASGPYALVRHPSYTGLLLELLALSLTYQHFISIALIMIPSFLVLMRRVRMEEKILEAHLGDEYRSYQQQTYFLLPYLF